MHHYTLDSIDDERTFFRHEWNRAEEHVLLFNFSCLLINELDIPLHDCFKTQVPAAACFWIVLWWIEGVPKGDCPGARAWGLLVWCQQTLANEREFWTRLYPMLLPTRKELDTDDRYADDGRKTFSVLDRIEELSERVQGNGVDPAMRQ